jgi:hypothetical protein
MKTSSAKINRAAIMNRAWYLVRIWEENARTRHHNSENGRMMVRAGYEQPRPYVRQPMRKRLPEAMRAAWQEAREEAARAFHPDLVAELEDAEADLMEAQAIESWRSAQPVIAHHQSRVRDLRAQLYGRSANGARAIAA